MNFSRSLIFVAATLGSMASASVVNIDFNFGVSPTFSGNAAGETGAPLNNFWNGATASGATASASGLLDSTGATTVTGLSPLGVGFTISGIAGSSSSLGEQELNAHETLMQDYLFLQSVDALTETSATGTITGLMAGQTYRILFYGQGDNMVGNGAAGQNSLFTIGSESKQTGYDTVVGLAESKEYVMFEVVADGTGEIDFLWRNVVPGLPTTGNVITDAAPNSSGSGSRFAALNGIQIVQVVPEPSSALLALLGAFGLMARRRR